MDNLLHYESNSSDDNESSVNEQNDDTINERRSESRRSLKKQYKRCNVESCDEKEDDEEEYQTKNTKKRQRRRETSGGEGKVILLSSPKEMELYPMHTFQRNIPHIKGNWTGTIYISLKESKERINNPYHNYNVQSYKRLKEFACTNIIKFRDEIITIKERKLNEKDTLLLNDIVIVPHIDIGMAKKNEIIKNKADGSLSSSCEEIPDDDSDSCNDHDVQDDEDNDCGLHISIAKQFHLQKQSIHSFLLDLEKQLKFVQRFSIQLNTNDSTESNDNLEILVNDNQTRSFLTIPIHNNDYHQHHHHHCKGNTNKMNELIEIINSLMRRYGLEPYYDNPKFHCSIASWKGHHDWITSSVNIQHSGDKEGSNNRTGSKVVEDFQKDSLTTFMIQGVNCNFGNTQKHFIKFNH